jgi:predicted transcriptional regulator
MPKTVPILTRVSPELKAKVKALAKDTRRSEAFVAKEAIEAYIAINEWQIAEIKRGLDEVLSGEPGIPHEEVVEYLKSWGTDRELPVPKPKKRP